MAAVRIRPVGRNRWGLPGLSKRNARIADEVRNLLRSHGDEQEPTQSAHRDDQDLRDSVEAAPAQHVEAKTPRSGLRAQGPAEGTYVPPLGPPARAAESQDLPRRPSAGGNTPVEGQLRDLLVGGGLTSEPGWADLLTTSYVRSAGWRPIVPTFSPRPVSVRASSLSAPWMSWNYHWPASIHDPVRSSAPLRFMDHHGDRILVIYADSHRAFLLTEGEGDGPDVHRDAVPVTWSEDLAGWVTRRDI